MAITIHTLGGLPSTLRVLYDAVADNTPEVNIADGACAVYAVLIDNSAVAAITYIKFFDTVTITLGTTAPDMQLPAQASGRILYVFRTGVSFATALSMAGVTAPGTAGTVSPTGSVPVTLFVK